MDLLNLHSPWRPKRLVVPPGPQGLMGWLMEGTCRQVEGRQGGLHAKRWWRCNESPWSGAGGGERCDLCEWRWHVLFIQLHWIINRKRATEGSGCCVIAIFSSFQFTATHVADALFYPGLTSGWHNILRRPLMGVRTRPQAHKSKRSETHSYTRPIPTSPRAAREDSQACWVTWTGIFHRNESQVAKGPQFLQCLATSYLMGPDSDSTWKALSAWMPVAPNPGLTEHTATLKSYWFSS